MDERQDMTLKDLSSSELLALIGLARRLVDLDGQVSRGEARYIASWADEVGEETLRAMLDEAASYLSGVENLQRLAGMVTRPDAQELILSELFALAIENGIDRAEDDLLAWLETTWTIKKSDQPFRD